jgi:dihydrofolate reductase
VVGYGAGMGNIIVEQVVTADGFAAGVDGNIEFFEGGRTLVELEDDELALLAHVDAIVLGARTYEMFAAYWPTADPAKERIAVPINALPKHVFSTKLAAAPWGEGPPATLERDDAATGIEALRRRYRGDLIIWGSLTLTEALFRFGLVDVLRLRTVPVLIGDGRSVAPKDLGTARLALVRSQSFPSGAVVSEYAVARPSAS